MIVKDFVDHMKFLSIKSKYHIEVVLHSVSIDAVWWISLCGSNDTSCQCRVMFNLLEETEKSEITSLSHLRAAVMAVLSNVNMKRLRRSLAWGHFKLKMMKFVVNTAKPCISTTTPMLYHLNNKTLHPILADVNASCSQPAIASVWAQRSRDAEVINVWYDCFFEIVSWRLSCV